MRSSQKTRTHRLQGESLEARLPLTSQLVISEFLADNNSFADEDGDYPDWLEILNPTAAPVDLGNWYLTDDADDLTQWRFPDRTLEPGERIVVFASGKDRVTGTELHANFRLNNQGEYLGLVEPDGATIAFDFAPEYPRQRPDVSYGLVQEAETLVEVGAAVQTQVPVDSLDPNWIEPGFDDSLWTTGTTGIGFEVGGQGTAIAYGNLLGSVGGQTYGGSLGMDFVVHEAITVTELGVFDSNADGLSRTITAQMWSRNGNAGTKLAELTFTSADPGELVESDRLKPLDTPLELLPGDYTIVAYGYGGGEPNGNAGAGGPGAEQKTMNAGNGVLSFVGGARYGNAGAFPGTTDSGPENRYSAGTFRYRVPAYEAWIGTDVEADMHGINATSVSRIDFPVTDRDQFSTLDLQMQYDDGFVAYLNGVEIARGNVTGIPRWNGVATATRGAETEFETFNVTEHLHALRSGTNTLAIHGLNVGAEDNDFLITPRLVAAGQLTGAAAVYFDVPTPGTPNRAASSFQGFVEDLDFSVERGFYDQPFSVAITSPTDGASIRYTTDGERPTETTGQVYSDPISINSTTTLTAMAFQAGYQSTAPVTHTYVFLKDVVDFSGIPAGYPTNWGGVTADYGMSQDATDLPRIAGDAGLSLTESKEVIQNSLLALPTLSIVIPSDDLFAASTGIYANPSQRGDAWERATSVEYLLPNGDDGFQINAGIQIMGGTSRNLDSNIRQSFRLVFKEEYGPGRLEYPFFPGNPVESFNTLALRTNSRDNWTSHQYTNSATYLRDEWSKRAAADMGQLATSSSFVHLYINGMYWGIYNPTERPDAAFLASHTGVDEDAVDTVKYCCPQRVVDGDWNEWNALRSLSAAGLANDAAYQRIQGNHPDGTRNPVYPVLIDIDNFIDYVIHGQFTGSEDWPGNYYVARDGGVDSEGFQFFTWDNDLAFRRNDKVTPDPGHNWWTESPGEMDIALRQNAEYRLRFADRVQQYYFNGGPLTSAAASARWNQLVEEMLQPLIAESARWGDYRRDVAPVGGRVLYTVDNQWSSTVNSVANYFEDRPATVLSQLRSRGLYPAVAAPVYQINSTAQHGGSILAGDTLSMTAAAAIVTTDTTLVSIDSTARAFVPTDDSLEIGAGPRWYDLGFDSAGWISGTNGVGYDNGDDYHSLIGTDVRDAWNAANRTSVYARFDFDLAAGFDAAVVERLELNMKFDDGYVVYLNGQLVHSTNVPSPAAWNSRATGKRLNILNTITSVVETTDLSDSIGLLRPGPNVLAIHILNHATDTVDILARPELVLSDDAQVAAPIYYTLDGTDPRQVGGAAVGITYDGTIPLTDTTEVNARAFVNDQWSALSQATFVVAESGSNLVISEINYNPHGPTAAELAALPTADNDDFEFLEVTNTSTTQSANLIGIQLIDGVTYAFGNEALAPGESAVVVEDATAFRLRYGDAARLLGEWSGSLSNGGETLQLVDGTGTTVTQVAYNDAVPWAARADGAGASLELVDMTGIPVDRLSKADSWRGSTDFGGSPGSAGTEPLGIVINEVLTHTDPPVVLSDSIELRNTTDQAIDIGGWYLSDAAGTLLKYAIPTGTVVGPGEFVVFDEHNFNPTPLNPGPLDFALSGANGDDVWLVVPDGTGGVRYFADDVHFGAAMNGVSFGRVDGASNRLAPLSTTSIGCQNDPPSVGPLVITEVHYDPSEPSTTARAIEPNLTKGDLEFVEIFNPTKAEVDLTGWRVRGGVELEFDLGTLIGAGESRLLIRFNPDAAENTNRVAAFRAHYGIDSSVVLIGGYSNQLGNEGDRVTLERSDSPPLDDPTFTPHVIEDEVLYDNLSPWSSIAAGQSLQRVSSISFGDTSGSWTAATATPGTVAFVPRLTGDFTADGTIAADDIDLLSATLHRGTTVNAYDLDGSGTVDAADRAFLVEQILGTLMGDANLDRQINAADLNIVGLNWQMPIDCLRWSDGDFNGDHAVDAVDLNFLGLNWLARAAAARARVPRAPLAASGAAVMDTSHAQSEFESVDLPSFESTANDATENSTGQDVQLGRQVRWQPAVRHRIRFSATASEPAAQATVANDLLDFVWSNWQPSGSW